MQDNNRGGTAQTQVGGTGVPRGPDLVSQTRPSLTLGRCCQSGPAARIQRRVEWWADPTCVQGVVGACCQTGFGQERFCALTCAGWVRPVGANGEPHGGGGRRGGQGGGAPLTLYCSCHQRSWWRWNTGSATRPGTRSSPQTPSGGAAAGQVRAGRTGNSKGVCDTAPTCPTPVMLPQPVLLPPTYGGRR